MVTWLGIYIGSGWLAAVILAPVLARRCAAAKAWGWLAVMFALPWVGVLVYLVLGENPLGRKRVVWYRQATRETGAGHVLAELVDHAAGGDLGRVAGKIERLARAAGAPAAVRGNDPTLLGSPDDMIRHLIEDIRRAEDHVHMVFYIFRDDETGRRVAEALIEAARRGVTVRLLADAVGSYPLFLGLGRRLEAGGVELHAALPVNPLRRRLGRIDLRNHRKIAVIDGRVAYLGSCNIADADYGRKNVNASYDLSVRLIGPVVLQVQLLFLEDWYFETHRTLEGQGAFPPPRPTGEAVLQVLPSGPMYPSPSARDLMVSAIHLAEKRVILTTPYLVPDEALMLSLRLAAQRGVQVDVIVPARSDLRLVDAVGRSYSRQLAAEGANVHVHQAGMLHTKALTIDNAFGTLGSVNFDIRSFHLNVEANLLIYSRPLVEALRRRQEEYIADSEKLDPRAPAPALRRLCEDVARLLSPLM